MVKLIMTLKGTVFVLKTATHFSCPLCMIIIMDI